MMNFAGSFQYPNPVPGYLFQGTTVLPYRHAQGALLPRVTPLRAPIRPGSAFKPQFMYQPYPAAQHTKSYPVPRQAMNSTVAEEGRGHNGQPDIPPPQSTSSPWLKQQANERAPNPQTSNPSLPSLSQSTAIPDNDSEKMVRHVGPSQGNTHVLSHNAVDGKILKDIRAMDRSLRLRKGMAEKDIKSLEDLLTLGPGGAALVEQLQRQLTLVTKEMDVLQDLVCIQDTVNDKLGLDPVTDDLLSDALADLSLDDHQGDDGVGLETSEAAEDELDSDALQTAEAAEDAIDLDAYEWFEARRRDPIVQEYIQAFERIMNQRRIDECAAKQAAGDVDISYDTEFPPLHAVHLSSSASEGIEEKAPPQKWVLQPTKSTVYAPIIHEEYLDEEQVKEKLASGELLACTLQIDSATHGNTAVAKVADPTKPDVIIQSREEINRAFNGDAVAVEVTGHVRDDPNAPKGKVVAICKEIHHREVVCSCDVIDRNIMVPMNKFNPRFVVMQSKEHDGVAIYGMKKGHICCKTSVTETKGKLFVLKLMQWGAGYRFPLGFVVRYFNAIQDPRSSMQVLAVEYGIHQRHAKETQADVKKSFPANWKIPEEERSSRVKYNNVFTVDPEGSLELDDALSVDTKEDGSHIVGVHITDVSYFIPKDSALDKAAYAHGQSVYPSPECGHHVPMLPPHLSTNLCSLLPGKTRLAVSTIFQFDAEGKEVQEPQVHRSLIRSCCKLSYEQCSDILGGGTPAEIPKRVQQSILLLGSLARKIAARRLRTGCVPDGDWGEIKSNQASKIVEEFMLLTNSAVALKLLESPQVKCLVPLRRQLQPKAHRLSQLVQKYAAQGLWPQHYLSLGCLRRFWPSDEESGDVNVDVAMWEDVSAALDRKDLEKLTSVLAKHCRSGPPADVLSSLGFLQEKSSYVVSCTVEPSLKGHFSLNAVAYTHFTSPLRRFFDLVVHRIQIAVLNGDEVPYSQEELDEICVHCQAMSARADAFEKHSSAVCIAHSLKSESKWKMAHVDSVSAEQFMFSGRELEGLTMAQRSVNLKDLKPSSREWNGQEGELVLTWNVVEVNLGKGLASASTNALDTQESEAMSRQFLKIPSTFWVSFLDAVRTEDFKKMNTCRQMVNKRAVVALKDLTLASGHGLPAETGHPTAVSPEQPYIQVHTQFYRRRDQVPVLFTGQLQHGLLQPTILAVHVAPSLLCCVRHRRRTVEVFCEALERPTQKVYSDVRQYQSITVPLLMAESATTSVNSDFSCRILVNSVSIKWTRDPVNKGIVRLKKLDLHVFG